MITPGRLLYLLRRDLAWGCAASFHFHRTAPRIVQYRCPHFSRRDADTPIHFLTGREDWLLALWMLASFHHFTQRRWPLVLHDDGTLPPEALSAMRKCFPQLRVISRTEADARMAHHLAHHPRCLRYRQQHPLARKIFDIPAFAEGERFLILDSDLLFFSRPDEVLDWVEMKRDECRFIRDAIEASNVPAAEAQSALNVTLWPQVNSGLCLLPRAALDLDFCEQALERTSILKGHIWRVEQTLFALCASRYGRGGLLSDAYEITLAPRGSVIATARHYVGAVRHHFYGEGLARLQRLVLST